MGYFDEMINKEPRNTGGLFDHLINERPEPARWSDVISSAPQIISGNITKGIGGTLEELGERQAPKAMDFLTDPTAILQVPEFLLKELAGVDLNIPALKEPGQIISSIGRDRVLENTPENMSFGQEAVSSAINSIGQMALPLLGNVLLPGSGAKTAPAFFGLTTGGSAFSDARDEGSSIADAQRHAQVSRVIEGGTELLPGKYLFGNQNPIKKIASYLAAELPGENISELSQRLSETANLGRKTPSLAEVRDIIAKTSAATALGGSAISGTQAAIDKGLGLVQDENAREVLGDEGLSRAADGFQEEQALTDAAKASIDLSETTNREEGLFDHLIYPEKETDIPLGEEGLTIDESLINSGFEDEASPVTGPLSEEEAIVEEEFSENVLNLAEQLGPEAEIILERASIQGAPDEVIVSALEQRIEDKFGQITEEEFTQDELLESPVVEETPDEAADLIINDLIQDEAQEAGIDTNEEQAETEANQKDQTEKAGTEAENLIIGEDNAPEKTITDEEKNAQEKTEGILETEDNLIIGEDNDLQAAAEETREQQERDEADTSQEEGVEDRDPAKAVQGEERRLLDETKKDSILDEEKTDKARSSVEEVKNLLPRKARSMVDAGNINIEQTSEAGSNVTGFYKDGVITLVADNVDQSNITEVLNHELFHRHLDINPKVKEKLTRHRGDIDDIFSDIFDKSYNAKYRPLMTAAMERVRQAETSQEDRLEELSAYLVSEYSKSPQSMPAKLRQMVGKFVNYIKNLARNAGIDTGKLTPGDLTAMARSSMTAEKAGHKQTVKFSKDSDTTKREFRINKRSDEPGKVEALKNWFSGLESSAKRGATGALSRHQLAIVTEDVLPTIKNNYLEMARQMDAERNEVDIETGDIAENWRKKGGKDKKGSEALSDIMHSSTIAGVDPSVAYVPIITKEEVTAQKEIIRQNALGSGLTGKASKDMTILDKKLAFEAKRKSAYPFLKKRYDSLVKSHPWTEEIYKKTRDYHADMFDKKIEALEERLGDSKPAKNVMAILRQKYENLKVTAPYFPISRIGDFWVTTKLGELDTDIAFNMFESPREQEQFIKQMKDEGLEVVGQGVKGSKDDNLDGVPGNFITQVDGILEKLGDDPMVQGVRDEIYQLYLKSLPDLSARKHFIHRKKTPGYGRDALISFSKKAFHDSIDLARLKYSHKLQQVIDDIELSIKASNSKSFHEQLEKRAEKEERLLEVLKSADNINEKDFEFAQYTFDELKKFHSYSLNPNVDPIVSKVNAFGFVYFLGATPAAAIINMSQTPTVSMPKVAAKFGIGKTTKAFSAALKDFFSTKDGQLSVEGSLKKPNEIKAFSDFTRSGLIDKTRAHDLAGIAQEGVERGSLGYRLMDGMSFMFHHSERLNRETTAMASYRLHYAENKDHDAAVEYAKDITWYTHLDYSSLNRARWMRGNWQRVALQFKQYSQGITFLYAREMRNAMKGATKEQKTEAKKTLAGLYLMQAAMAGTSGLAGAQVVKFFVENIYKIIDDEDDPTDFEGEVKRILNEKLTPTASKLITRGMIDGLTPISVSNRLSVADLWIRESDRDIEGRAANYHLMKNAFGPMTAVFENILVGGSLISDGKVVRGIEKMLPKFARDINKSIRYATEGVKNLAGDDLVDDVELAEIAAQMLGFQPVRINERYDRANAIYRVSKDRQDRRKELITKAVDARGTKDYPEVKEEIAEYNSKVSRERKIFLKHIRSSRKTSDRIRKSKVSGIRVRKRDRDLLDRYQ